MSNGLFNIALETGFIIIQNYFQMEVELKTFESLRPGKMNGAPMVNDIKAIRYSKDGVCFKLVFSQEWQHLPIRLNLSKLPFLKNNTREKSKLKLRNMYIFSSLN